MNAERLIEVFQRGLPFNRHLGMRVDQLTEGRCRVSLPFADHLIGDPERPALHGGVISTLADTAGGLAAASTLDWSRYVLSTVDLRVDYLRHGHPQTLLCDAHVLRAGNRVCVTTMVLHHGDPTSYTIAEARGVYNIRARKS